MIFSKRLNIPGFRKKIVLAALILGSYSAIAQHSADKIITIVGKDIILQSELEMQALNMKQQNPAFDDTMKCQLLMGMIMQKLLKAQAERDSVYVTEEDVEGQLDNRLRYFTQLYGSKEKLEQASGKTVYQIKEENRDIIRDQMVAEKMQGQILEHVKITPAEAEAFYKKIPTDSLPFFPAAVEVGQIVIDPIVSQEMNDYARTELERIKKEEILGGKKTFEQAAGVYSQDPGSRDNGGLYEGVTRTGPWAAEFLSAAFKLQNNEISPIVKTKFGYHIIQMVSRRGDEADVRHILIKPEVTSGDFKLSLERLDSIRNVLIAGKMSFPEAVGKFSTDEAAKRTGGMIADPSTGNTELEISKLDAQMVLLLDSMKVGDYSAPHIFVTDMRDRSARIVYLRTRTEPHRANLKDDYGKIQDVALSHKKQLKLQNWVKSMLPTYYLWIAPEYKDCSILKEWILSANKAN
ncbi:MAG: peptidylprolyl isomerase [Flavipsychrobacter sp.]|jgi:peptidyl-prolyl cis-trans isomerase SurA|nr:peptidylprolyl isomerase [Flavipsychrobacter sp.]